ncbi:hypothetical protein GA0115259_105097 [Streptomyces sp. MnatMP-M17]|uniref:DUF7848 domain-containing protein n=2 Tax=unclassified Streptomyces TaxID=2593676 RepID=UPI00081E6CDF|nr:MULTISPECIES: hypothetical protein [unclassified Streptomyces]SCF93326.1 hypothetical protein GA0115259_105097 [Streptomyces sp. MnatMP-M17]
MSPRAVLRHETWTLEPDREPDAEPTTYVMQCAVDGETSPPSEDFAEPQNWVLKHCGLHPSHHTYRAARRQPHIRQGITRPWRTWRRT